LVETLPRTRDSRALILRAARQEFAEHGFAGARMARVAQAANVNKQLIFYYFKSKTGLYSAATQAPPPTADIEPAGRAGPPERLRQVVNRLATYLEERPEIAMALHDREADLRVHGAGREFASTALRELTEVISRGQGMGYFRDDLDPSLASRQALALVTGLHALGTGPADGLDAARWGSAASDLLVRAFAW
jgi:AcrR family transcriptional regulator